IGPPRVRVDTDRIEASCGVTQRCEDADVDLLGLPIAGRVDAYECLASTGFVDTREEVVSGLQAGRGNEPDLAPCVQGRGLFHIPACGRGGSDDLGGFAAVSSREILEDRFVQRVETSKWPGDEMQLVLDEQCGA